jgi:hypothetical protein
MAHRGTGDPVPASAPGLPLRKGTSGSSAAAVACPPSLLWAAHGAQHSPSARMLERKVEVSGDIFRKAQTTHKRSEPHRGTFKITTALWPGGVCLHAPYGSLFLGLQEHPTPGTSSGPGPIAIGVYNTVNT